MKQKEDFTWNRKKAFFIIFKGLFRWNTKNSRHTLKRPKIERYPIIFIYYLVVWRPPLVYHQGDRVNDSMLITAFIQVSTQRYWGPRNEDESPSKTKHLVRFEAKTFKFISNNRPWKSPIWGFQDHLIDSSIISFPNETPITYSNKHFQVEQ